VKSNEWELVCELFEEAIARRPEERQAFLNARCGQEGKLRRTVEELLAADLEDDTFLDQGLVDLPFVQGTSAKSDPTVALPGLLEGNTRIGPYRILRRIGQGGMSIVYLAVRADDSFNRRVVVKLVRPDMESDSIFERLRTERQILASLKHPWIARLYDGGTTEDGLPYFVLEYIEGLPLDKYCEQNRLTIDERLTLMCKVCAAVHYAHQNLVVHRDLKPSNILVTAEGEPKLLDFGIAKMLNPELAATGLEPTVTWHRVLTPNYASPEQIHGQLITTGSDVYALGVLLYKVLTGRLPHSFAGRSMHEIAQILTETEPLPPSLALTRPDEENRENRWQVSSTGADAQNEPSAVDLRRRLAGDLDAIVLKALRCVPRQRYGSVEQLADDIERYQCGRPVKARRGSWTYYAGKFIHRNRQAAAALGAVALLLFGFVVAMGFQTSRVAFERDQARLERDKKGEVLTLVLELFQLSNPYVMPGEELTVREALERSVPVLKDGLREQPDVRAELLHTSGSILDVLGVYDVAEEQLTEALEIRQRLYGEEHPDVVETSSALASVYKEQGEFDRAEELARWAVAVSRRQTEDGSPTAESLNGLVSVLCYRSAYEAAEELAKEALALTQELPERSIQRISALGHLARVKSTLGNYSEAVRLNREALARRRAHFGEKHPGQIATLVNLGVNLRRMEELAAAERAYAEALALWRDNFSEANVDFTLLHNIGRVRYARGNFADAEAIYREARDAALKIHPQHPMIFLFDLRIASTWIHRDAAAEAEDTLRRLLESWRGKLGEGWRGDEAIGILGESVSVQGRCAEAEPLLVGSFEQLLKKAKVWAQQEGLGRLRAHFERCDDPQGTARFEAMLEAAGRLEE